MAGYNSDNFDVPMLIEEFGRVGVAFPEKETKFIDVLKIERKVNSHKLGDTYQRYIGEELEGAHDALIEISTPPSRSFTSNWNKMIICLAQLQIRKPSAKENFNG